jgi:hypothetical protein
MLAKAAVVPARVVVLDPAPDMERCCTVGYAAETRFVFDRTENAAIPVKQWGTRSTTTARFCDDDARSRHCAAIARRTAGAERRPRAHIAVGQAARHDARLRVGERRARCTVTVGSLRDNARARVRAVATADIARTEVTPVSAPPRGETTSLR